MAFQKYEDELPEDFNDDASMDGETFADALANDEDFRDAFESGQPMGEWDH